MTRCAMGDPTRAQCGTLCVVAARSPLRCGPVWRATNYGFDAARMCEQLQRSFTLRGADAFTDHGAEKSATAEKTTVEIFLRPLPLCLVTSIFFSLFSTLTMYLNRVARKKGNKNFVQKGGIKLGLESLN